MLRRTAALLASGALALGGAALLVPTPATAQQDAGIQNAARGRLLTQSQRQQLRSSGHVQVSKQTKKHGTVTLLIQRGQVTALTPDSISLLSKDGFRHSYRITSQTKVKERRVTVPLTELKVGERAMVVALVTKDGAVARRISCLRPA